MATVKYHYAYDESHNLVAIDSLEKEESLKHTYTCIACGKEMVACIGTHNRPYFRHKVKDDDALCNPESYLHKLAKLRIKQRFDDKTRPFKIQLCREVVCSEKDKCAFYEDYHCKGYKELDPWNLQDYYDTCKEEQHIGDYVADLLLTDSKGKYSTPVLIEIFCSHKCEVEKINSGYKIIELRIKSETDIDNFCNEMISENDRDKVSFYGFKAKVRLTGGSITRFEYFRSGSAYVHNIDEYISCEKMNQRMNPRSYIELNVPVGYLSYPNTYDAGLVYLRNNGINIRNCMLCKFYHGYGESILNDFPICGLYKKCGTPHYPKQSDAMQCEHYTENATRINDTNKLLKKVKITRVF